MFVAYVDSRHPEWYDREYQVRRELLNEQIAEHPQEPVCLVVGSSRLIAGFMPETLPPMHDSSGREVLIFNYVHFGAGPRMNLIQIHRALRDGVKPTHAVIEIVPGFFRHDDLPVKEIAIHDVPILWPYSNKPRLVGSTVGFRLNGVYRPRTALLRSIAPDWVTQAENEKDPVLYPLGGDNHWARLDEPTEKERTMLRMLAIGRFASRMQTFRLDPHLTGATIELLELCRANNIQVSVIMTPENSEFLSWYSPEAESILDPFLNELRTRFNVPIIDGRRWLGDEYFSDPHHLKTKGAEAYTKRLGTEVIAPLLLRK
jgi:hypothetical protein